MQWFEKIYKKRFSSEEIQKTDSGLDGIDSSELWSQISQAIPQEEPTNNLISWRGALGLLLFLGLCATGLIIYKNNQTVENNLAENSSTSFDNERKSKSAYNYTSIKTKESINDSINNSELNSQKEDRKNINPTDHNLILTDPSVTNHIIESIESKISKKEKTQIAQVNTIESNPSNENAINPKLNTRIIPKKKEDSQKPISPRDSLAPDAFELNLENIKSDTRTAHGKNSRDTELVNLKDKTTSNNSFNNTSVEVIDSEVIPEKSNSTQRPIIRIQKLIHNWPQSPELNINSGIVFPFTEPIKVNTVPNPWSIKLFTQLNRLNQQYDDATNTELFADKANQSIDSLQYGTGVGIHLAYRINNTWSISTGLESNRFENKLSTVISTNTMVFDSIQMKNRNALNIRTVRHNNKISTITIPINITYDYRISKRFHIGTSVGLAYSLVTSQNVKLLGRDNSIIEINESDKQFNNYLSIRFNPYISYRLNDRFDISADLGFSMQDHGTSSLLDLNHKSTILSAGFGLRYRFN